MNTEVLRDKINLQREKSHQKNQTQQSFLILSHYYYYYYYCRLLKSIFGLSTRLHMPPLLLLSVLLLGVWPADGAQNASEPEVSPTSLHIVAKEGDSMLIECNVTGGHDGVQWFNSKGPLTGDGKRRRVFFFYLQLLPNADFSETGFVGFLKLGQKSTRLCRRSRKPPVSLNLVNLQ